MRIDFIQSFLQLTFDSSNFENDICSLNFFHYVYCMFDRKWKTDEWWKHVWRRITWSSPSPMGMWQLYAPFLPLERDIFNEQPIEWNAVGVQ